MSREYCQLSIEERAVIRVLVDPGIKLRVIAQHLPEPRPPSAGNSIVTAAKGAIERLLLTRRWLKEGASLLLSYSPTHPCGC